jgi:hypothetical protein
MEKDRWSMENYLRKLFWNTCDREGGTEIKSVASECCNRIKGTGNILVII